MTAFSSSVSLAFLAENVMPIWEQILGGTILYIAVLELTRAQAGLSSNASETEGKKLTF